MSTTGQMAILYGAPLDKRLRHEREVLIGALEVAIDALKFDGGPTAVQAMRTIHRRLRDAGCHEIIATLRQSRTAP